DRHVVASVVADLEAVFVELGDLIPGHVVALVGREVEPFGDEEGRAELVFLEQWGRNRRVRLAGVVKGENDEFVRDGLDGQRGEYKQEQASGNEAHAPNHTRGARFG